MLSSLSVLSASYERRISVSDPETEDNWGQQLSPSIAGCGEGGLGGPNIWPGHVGRSKINVLPATAASLDEL